MKRLSVRLLLVLFVSVSILAMWIQAPLIQKDITHRVNLDLQDGERPQLVKASADGRFVTLNGTVGSDPARLSVQTATEQVRGGLKVSQDLALLPVADPYVFSIEKHSDGKVTVTGYVENKLERRNLTAHANTLFGRENVSAELKLAAGMPDKTWLSMARRGMNAMDKVIFGEAVLKNRRLSVSGVAESFTFVDLAKETVTSGLPEAYKNQGGLLDIRWQPPLVQPYQVQFLKPEKGRGVRLQGVRPDKAFEDDLTGLLRQDQSVDLVELDDARGVPDANWVGVAKSAAAIPGKLVRGRVLLSDTELRVSGLVSDPGFISEIDLIFVNLPAPYTGRKDIRLAEPEPKAGPEPEPKPEAGSEEGGEPVFLTFGSLRNVKGYRLPAVLGEPDRASCKRTLDRVLAEKKPVFETGSAILSAGNRQVLNKLAAVLSKCMTALAVSIEIGGHTDSSGTQEANQRLSLARANAVKNALLARGVDAAYLKTRGYGALKPVSGNETGAGRALNRRIGFEIFEN